jgi:tungstate transport system ATP-binding protein
MSTLIKLQGAALAYPGGPVVLKDIHLSVGEHERVALIGPNGCGKSTLLRLVHGLMLPASGLRLARPGLRAAMLFQRPHMLNTTARRHVALGPWLAGSSWSQALGLADEALQRVGLAHIAGQSARTLSGGQQQRIALARVWALQPDVLLLDEPTSSLDPRAKQEVEQLLSQWISGPDAPALVFASHNLGQVKRLATRVVYIESGQILADLPVHDFFQGPLEQTHPQAHLFVRGETP